MATGQIQIEKNYYNNAIFFVEYRTGKKVDKVAENDLITRINNLGYVLIIGEDILVILVRREAEFMDKSTNFGTVLTRILSKYKATKFAEIYLSIMITETVDEFKRVGGYMNQFSSITADQCPDAYSLFLYKGMFAFNAFNRSLPIREDFMKNLDKTSNVLIEQKNRLLTRPITAAESKLYSQYISLKSIPKIQADDPICIWNKYKVGDVIMAESLTLTSLKSQLYFQIIPVAALSTKATQSEEGVEADD